MALQPFQERVVAEKAARATELRSLTSFIAGDVFQTLHEAERDRMLRQRSIMADLCVVLQERIDHFVVGGGVFAKTLPKMPRSKLTRHQRLTPTRSHLGWWALRPPPLPFRAADAHHR